MTLKRQVNIEHPYGLQFFTYQSKRQSSFVTVCGCVRHRTTL